MWLQYSEIRYLLLDVGCSMDIYCSTFCTLTHYIFTLNFTHWMNLGLDMM